MKKAEPPVVLDDITQPGDKTPPEPTCKPTPANPLELHGLRNKAAHGFECLDALERELGAMSPEAQAALDGLRGRLREFVLLCGLPFTELPR